MEIEKEVRLTIRKFRKIKFKDDEDLYKKGIVDSFDIVNIISNLENKYSIKINFVSDNKFIFSVKNLSKKIFKLLKK